MSFEPRVLKSYHEGFTVLNRFSKFWDRFLIAIFIYQTTNAKL